MARDLASSCQALPYALAAAQDIGVFPLGYEAQRYRRAHELGTGPGAPTSRGRGAHRLSTHDEWLWGIYAAK